MKTKLIFSTEKNDIEQWTDLPFIPRIGEWFNLRDILSADEITDIKSSSRDWSGISGEIRSVEYRHDDNEFYTELVIGCEDNLFKK